MLTFLFVLYVSTSYWYFWQILRESEGATARELVLCATLGFLIGPLLLAGAVLLRVLPSPKH